MNIDTKKNIPKYEIKLYNAHLWFILSFKKSKNLKKFNDKNSYHINSKILFFNDFKLSKKIYIQKR